MSLCIIQPGILSLVQDFGRYGYQHIGVTVGGPMDEHSFLWNNRLLDNPRDAAQIEITIGLFKCCFHQATTIALCGAFSDITVNDTPLLPWHSYTVNSGDILSVGAAREGVYGYLAVKGGLKPPLHLESRSCVVRDELGGLDHKGSPLKAGDIITYNETSPLMERRVLKKYIPTYQKEIKLGLLPSYQFNKLSKREQKKLFKSSYEVTRQINRMGYRLSGEGVFFENSDFISEPIVLGSVQVPADGQPIILMKDHQTIGGYPKAGCIQRSDIGKLAQAQQGTKVQFYKADLQKAALKWQQFIKFFS